MKYLIAFLLFMLNSCGSNFAGSGSDNPDFSVIITVADNRPVSNIAVRLVPSTYSPLDTTSGTIQEQITASDESVRFSGVPSSFSIEVIDTTANLAALIMNVVPSSEPRTINVVAMGSVELVIPDSLLTDSLTLIVDGTTIVRSVSRRSSYEQGHTAVLFTNIPAAQISSARLIAQTKKLLDPITVISRDTVTQSIAGISESIRPIWRVPVLVGVSDSMVAYFGGIDSVRTLVKDHFARLAPTFSGPEFSGVMVCEIESLYVYSGAVGDQNIAPPQGFEFRLLYSPFESSTFGQYDHDTRVLLHDLSPTYPGGIFGEESMINLAWLFGIGRGAYYVVKEEVFADQNMVTKLAYELDPTVMALRSALVWDDYSVQCLNRIGETHVSGDSLQMSTVETIELTILDNAGKPVPDCEIALYGSVPYSHAVRDSVLQIETTNQNGVVSFSQPYLSTLSGEMLFSNILVKITTGTAVSYQWIPFSEVSAAHLKNGAELFKKVIQI